MKKYFQCRSLLTFAFLVAALSMVSCEKYVIESTEIDPTDPRSFQSEIIPIFNANCVSCHAGSVAPDLRADKAYNSLKTGAYYSVATPEESKIYKKLIESSSHQAKATTDQKKYILYWIGQGALDN